jgi:uncharacterized protein (DUF1015 family)
MNLIQPFPALRPASERANDVVAPPYDVLSTDEARERASGRPWSFLHISKPEIDLPAGTNPYAPEVYAKGAENLQAMIQAGVLVQDAAPCYYAYRIVMGSHSQTGIVAAASVADYDTNRIRKHEFTRPDKEDDRVRQIDALNAQTGPVLLAYPAAPDGHHRSASASRIAAARRAANPGHTGAEPYNFFLSVIFPAHQMHILDYNRVITDLNGLRAEAFLERVSHAFSVEPAAAAVKPERPGSFGLYLAGRWYRLDIRPDLIPADPVGRLDVSLLQNNLIAPILGITDPRRDKRIDFVGGIRGLAELEKRVNSGAMALAFALHPTRMEDLMAVADANEVMPPKSTWFEPKLADGLASHVLG